MRTNELLAKSQMSQQRIERGLRQGIVLWQIQLELALPRLVTSAGSHALSGPSELHLC